MIKITAVLIGWLCLSGNIQAQFTRHDTLRGKLTALRNTYDVHYYDLHLRVDPENKYIKGKNSICYKIKKDFKSLQIDLFEPLQITQILHHGRDLQFERDSNAVFVHFNTLQKKGTTDQITVFYEGHPRKAVHAPWDGGFSWAKDKKDRDWIGISCEGLGASVWWPNKDHLSEEPDSMRIRCEVPSALTCVANGRFMNKKVLDDGYTLYDWKVSYPINNYNVTLNIAHYAHIHDWYVNDQKDSLDLDYYVLDYNKDQAKKHFEQVKEMLAIYEKKFGRYPFWNDGYKLVETPYWGMEHQSAIAYGNNYRNNNFDFDFIIIHESGHEYWGNSVSCRDHAELWIHEAFCTYAEFLYLEERSGYEKALEYLKIQKKNIRNKTPILGPLEVNFNNWGDSDMYYKGSWMLHTLRGSLDNDVLWFELIYEIAQDFKLKHLSTKEIIAYINHKTGRNLNSFFDQYLTQTTIPTLEYKIKGNKVYYKWSNTVKGFSMPLKIKDGIVSVHINPSNKWKKTKIKNEEVEIDTDRYYINTLKHK